MKKIIYILIALTYAYSNINAQEPRLILVEQMTTSSSNSPQLVPLSQQFNQIVNSNPEVVPLTIHQNFNVDKFYNQRKDLADRILHYTNEFPIPSLYVNGTEVLGMNNLSSKINSEKGQISPLKLKVQEDRASSTTLFVDVKIDTDTILKTPDLLFCAIIERHINDPTAGNPNEKDFYYVTRRIGLQPLSGAQIDLNEFGYSGNRFAFQIEDFWNMEEIYAIAWVQNNQTKEVLQAEEVKTYNEKPTIQSQVDTVIFDESNKNEIYQFEVYNSSMGYLNLDSVYLESEENFTLFYNSFEKRIYPGQFALVNVQLNETEIGEYMTNIVINSNADNTPNLLVPVVAKVESSTNPIITASTDKIDFGKVSTSLTKELVISNTGDGPLKIDSIYFTDDYDGELRILNNFFPDIAENDDFKLQINFQPSEAKQYFSNLVIKTNATNNAELQVEIRGEGDQLKQFASISLATDSLDFGIADFVEPSRKSIVIENKGNAVLEIKNSAIENNTGSAFSFSGTKDLNITAQGQDSLVIDFLPTENIEYTATLVIRSNDDDAAKRRIEIPLRGMGDGQSTVTNFVDGFNVYHSGQSLMFDVKNSNIHNVVVKFYDINGKELLNKEYDIQRGVSELNTSGFGQNKPIFYQVTSDGLLLSNGKFIN